MRTAILQIEGVSVNFSGLKALQGVHFQVPQGSIFSVIGPNGAGKTTLFNTISGNQKPSQGLVRFEEQIISHLPPHRICWRGISRTYQHVRPFLGMSVRENVAVGLLYGRHERPALSEVEVDLTRLLEMMELAGKAQVLAESLTPLERKRLEIARALATRPRLLLLDELMAGLTGTETLTMMHTIRRINQEGITILLIEHVMKAVMELSHEVVVLHHGETIASGTPSDVANDPYVIEAYLGKKAMSMLQVNPPEAT